MTTKLTYSFILLTCIMMLVGCCHKMANNYEYSNEICLFVGGSFVFFMYKLFGK